MEWKIVDAMIYHCLPPIARGMYGQIKLVQPLKQEPIHLMGFGNVGIAALQTFIWISQRLWMWAYVTGPIR